jgi:hypothetical protein
LGKNRGVLITPDVTAMDADDREPELVTEGAIGRTVTRSTM